MPEDEDDADGTTMELPVLETELGNQELEQAVVIRQEEFAEIERGIENIEEDLKDKKVGEVGVTLTPLCCEDT